jgi:phosphoglycerate dehydrogenase-like enzyme
MRKILVNAPFPEELMQKIRAVSTQITVEQSAHDSYDWPAERRTDAEVIYTRGGVPAPEQAPNLHWVQTHYAGVDGLAGTPLWDSDILISSSSGIHAPNMAQYVMTQILVWAGRVPEWTAVQQQAHWPRNRWNRFLPDELRGRTLGILGYGSVGRELARLAKPFGMRILVTKRDARQVRDTGYVIPNTGDPQGELPDRIYPSEATRSMLAECDYAVLTLPLTEKTRNLIDANMLKEMPAHAYLINVGRGGLIVEDDLIRGLKKGWIAGAGLDVFETEPLPDDNPLWKMENVVLTPHVSGFTAAYDGRAVDLFVENLRRYLAGDPLFNVVNREEGY